MQLIESVSWPLNAVSWIWGGFTTDIYMGQILREHDDLDYLTLNLHLLSSQFVEAFLNYGWRAEDLVNGDLKLKKDRVKAHLGNVDVVMLQSGRIMVREALSSSCFMAEPRYVVASELQYVLKERPELLNPDWLIREKDILEKVHLRDILFKKGIDVCSLHKLVTSI
jgi:hypothetical protein